MEYALNLLFQKIIPPEHEQLIASRLFAENIQRIRVLIILSLVLTILFGLGSNLISYLQQHEMVPTLWHAIIVHSAIIIFQAFCFFYLQTFSTPASAASVKAKQSLSVFTVVYGCFYIGLTTLLTIHEEFNASRALIYTIALMLLSVFLLLKPIWFCIMFGVGLTTLFVILLTASETLSLAFSTCALALVITFSGYMIATFLFNNFVQRTISAETIRIQRESLENSISEKDAILSIVAHDLRTPVTNIDQLARLVELNGTGNTENSQLLVHIRESCQQAYQIIADLIDNSDSKIKDLQNRTHTDLQQLFSHTLALGEKRFREKNIQVHVQESQGPLVANINPSKFERVFDNLLSNAAKFTHANGHVKVRFTKKGSKAEIIFEDDGIGIPAEIRGHLFKPFSQARRRGIDGEKTTGLGLSIVKNIIDIHNGSIEVSSKEGKGTTFTIQIPLAG